MLNACLFQKSWRLDKTCDGLLHHTQSETETEIEEEKHTEMETSFCCDPNHMLSYPYALGNVCVCVCVCVCLCVYVCAQHV